MALCGLREIHGLCAGALIGLALFALSGCASAQAKGSTDKPALDVPPPPPHVIELPAEPLEPVGEIPNPSAPTPSAAHPPRPPAPKPSGNEAKPESKPDNPQAGQPATQPETPAPVPQPPPPAPELRTPQTADPGTAATIHTTIDRARSSLSTVKYAPLSNERKKAYQDAQQFIVQAEDALKAGNIAFAKAVAEKAEKMARELAGR